MRNIVNGTGLLVGVLALSPVWGAEPEFTRKQDIIYGRKWGTALTMDVFTPKKPNGAGVIFAVSGGWFSSHDNINPAYIGELLRHGYTTFAVVHGSQPEFTIPEIVQDMHRAVRFIRYHAKDYGIDPDCLGITGASAGGHLSLMLGTTGGQGDPKAKDPVDRASSRIKAVGCFFPPTDFLNFGAKDFVLIGTAIQPPFRAAFAFREFDKSKRLFEPITDRDRIRAIYKDISPIYHVSKDSAPTLIIQGDEDKLVPKQQAEIMCARYKEMGVPTKLIIKKGAGHGWATILLDTKAIADWFDAYLKPAGNAKTSSANWPQFRGPGARGVAEDAGLPEKWSTTENVAWKTPIPGRGWSSPVVWGDKVFLTSVTREGKEEVAAKGLYFGGNRTTPPKDKHRWMIYCLDLNSGKILWEKQVHEGVPEATHHIKNTFASETPVTDGERVYAYFGNLGIFCFNMAGKEVWSKKLGNFRTKFGWGTAASPVLFQGKLFIVNDNEENSFLACLDAKTGSEIWRIDRDEKSNWATPYVWQNGQRTELVTSGAGRVRSYDLDGKLLWELKGMSNIAIPTPCAGHGLLYLSSGYVMDATRPVYAIRPGASGDISLKKGETGNASVAWFQKTAGPYNPSPVLYGDYLYVLRDRGFLSCYDAKTGKTLYEGQRIGPKANAFTASPWAYNGKVFCLSEDGDTFVFQAGPEYNLLHKNSLGEMCMATPAIIGDSLLIRTDANLYRIQAGAKSNASAAAAK